MKKWNLTQGGSFKIWFYFLHFGIISLRKENYRKGHAC